MKPYTCGSVKARGLAVCEVLLKNSLNFVFSRQDELNINAESGQYRVGFILVSVVKL